ncbi:transglutaminase family protein [Candidatus Hydrogenedentota bacterium]
MSIRRRRLWIFFWAGAICLWIVTTAILIRREFFLPVLPTNDNLAIGRTSRTNTWMGVYMGGEKVGYSRFQRNSDSDKPGMAVHRNRTRLRLNLLGSPVELETSSKTILDETGRPTEFSFTLDSSGHKLAVEGKATGSGLDVRIDTGGEIYEKTIEMGGEFAFFDRFSLGIAIPKMEKHRTYALDVFEPLSASAQKARITYVGDEELAILGKTDSFAKVEIDIQGAKSNAWLDRNGDVVKLATIMGLEMVREPPNEAISAITDGAESAGPLMDMAALSSVPVGTKIEEARRVEYMKVRITGISPADYDLDGGTQRVTDSIKGIVEIGPVSLPAGPPALSVADGPDPELLKPSVFVQSENSRIVETAASIVGDEPDPWVAAVKIARWVNANVEKRIVASVPSAVDVLNTLEGDCNEHTVLFTALARAAGVPARTAIGLVYSEDYGDKSFYYHAWPEVFVGAWVPMDPTFGQDIADATHVRLINGDIDQWIGILQILGQINIEVLEVKYAPELTVAQ